MPAATCPHVYIQLGHMIAAPQSLAATSNAGDDQPSLESAPSPEGEGERESNNMLSEGNRVQDQRWGFRV
jgi:hypothetical protein